MPDLANITASVQSTKEKQGAVYATIRSAHPHCAAEKSIWQYAVTLNTIALT